MCTEKTGLKICQDREGGLFKNLRGRGRRIKEGDTLKRKLFC